MREERWERMRWERWKKRRLEAQGVTRSPETLRAFWVERLELKGVQSGGALVCVVFVPCNFRIFN